MHTRSTFGSFDFFVDDDDEFVDATGADFPVSVSWRVAGLCVAEDVRVGGIVFGIIATWSENVNTTPHTFVLSCFVGRTI